MKTLCFFLLAIPCVAPASDGSAKPSAEPIARYQAMIDRSPFALATESAPAPAPAENAGFAKDLVLTGAVRLSSGEYITIASKDKSQQFSLRTGETRNDIALVSVAWSDSVGKTRATLKRGTEYGIVSFDEAAARAGAAVAAPPGPPPQGAPPFSPNGQPLLPPGVTIPEVIQPAQGSGANSANPAVRRGRVIRGIPGTPAGNP